VRHCPIQGCGDQIDPSRLMCRRHWYTVPKELRDRVWASWRSGQGAYSREHREAVSTAVGAVLAATGQAAAGAPGKAAAPGNAAAPGKAGAAGKVTAAG
jgi:hypothetical protein